MRRIIEFVINDFENIEVQKESDDIQIDRYDEISILYKNNKVEYVLYEDDFVIEAIIAFQRLLQKAINSTLELDKSIVGKGIGFYSNQNFQGISGLVMVDDENIWVGDKYLIWDSMNYQTWLYNINEEIIFEITPTYRWHFDEPDENDDSYITFEEFIANYKTCLVKNISKEVAIVWLEKCNEILKRID